MKILIRDAIGKIYHFPFSFPWIILSLIICLIRSFTYSLKIDSGGGKIIITDPFISFKIIKHSKAKLSIIGTLKIVPHVNGNNRIVFNLGSTSVFSINGDFCIGQGVRIFLSQDALLSIGGNDQESSSGISADTLIMVFKKIEIGKDFLCAWNIYITDSDWHQINNQKHHSDVIIGNHVWIANNVTLLKGTVLGNNIIVASNSKVGGNSFSDNVLIAGIPAKVIRNDIKWSRDII